MKCFLIVKMKNLLYVFVQLIYCIFLTQFKSVYYCNCLTLQEL